MKHDCMFDDRDSECLSIRDAAQSAVEEEDDHFVCRICGRRYEEREEAVECAESDMEDVYE